MCIPNVTYTDLPYVIDAGDACSAGLVNNTLDFVSIVKATN